MTLMITGGTGKLGRELRNIYPEALAPTHSTLDLRNPTAVRDYVGSNSVDTIIHTAALVSVRECETYRERAWETNVGATRNLLYSLPREGYFVYISTPAVFRGDEPEKYYIEDDVAYPKQFYGLTKFVSETLVAEIEHREGRKISSLIIRTNFGARGKWPYPQAFADRYGTYLYIDQVAGEIKRLVQMGPIGIIHVCGDKRMSMYEFARIEDPEVRPLGLMQYEGPPLTVNMCLASTKSKPLRLGT